MHPSEEIAKRIEAAELRYAQATEALAPYDRKGNYVAGAHRPASEGGTILYDPALVPAELLAEMRDAERGPNSPVALRAAMLRAERPLYEAALDLYRALNDVARDCARPEAWLDQVCAALRKARGE